MAAYIRQKPPGWFWLVAILFTLWQLIGCAAFYYHAVIGPSDPYQHQLAASMPGWYVVVFAVAVLTGLGGALSLLGRSRLAHPLFVVSLIAVVIQYGYAFLATGVIAHQGAASAMGLPVTIAIVGAVQIWFAVHARRRGWIA